VVRVVIGAGVAVPPQAARQTPNANLRILDYL
jgi:hypothetical protein